MPDQQMSPERASFLTHANYISAFALLSGQNPFNNQQQTLAFIADNFSAPELKHQGLFHTDLPELRANLHRAWGTELILLTSMQYASDDEIVRLANIWGAIQVYYATHSAIRALCAAKGRDRVGSHEAIQKIFLDEWIGRGIDLLPWTLALDGQGYQGIPAGQVIDDSIHAWSMPTDQTTALLLAAKALRTTRDDAVTEGIKKRRREKLNEQKRAWKGEEAQRQAAGRKPRKEPLWPTTVKLSLEEQDDVRSRQRASGFIDYLYRLRIKANYDDAHIFTEGPVTEAESRAVAVDLISIASSTLWVHELRIAAAVGKAVLTDEIDQWLADHYPTQITGGLRERRELLN